MIPAAVACLCVPISMPAYFFKKDLTTISDNDIIDTDISYVDMIIKEVTDLE